MTNLFDNASKDWDLSKGSDQPTILRFCEVHKTRTAHKDSKCVECVKASRGVS